MKRQEVPLEERFKYVSDDDDSLGSDDDEWTMGTKPKKEKEPEQPVNWGMIHYVNYIGSMIQESARNLLEKQLHHVEAL